MRLSVPLPRRSSLLLGLAALAMALAACGWIGNSQSDASDAASEPPPEESPEQITYRSVDPPSKAGERAADEAVDRGPQPDPEAARDADPAFEPPLKVGDGPPPAPPAFEPYVLAEGETLPNAKRLAADIVQALTTYEPGQTREQIAAPLIGDEGLQALVDVMAPIHHEGAWSVGQIIYPQLGGATADDTSVMVVVEQTVGRPDGSILRESRTMDIRLVNVDGAWQLDEVDSVGGTAVPRPSDLSAAATTVVDSDRIELPDTARWDIYAGRVQESLLELMAEISAEFEYGVIVLDEGHPLNVWNSDHLSQHSRGLAVDFYRVGDVQVIDGRAEGSKMHDFVRWLYDREDVRKIGAPWALDARGGRSFTDMVHQDHLHIEAYAEGETRHDPDDARLQTAD